jgi:thiosulfate reductase cytochrome b subunit
MVKSSLLSDKSVVVAVLVTLIGTASSWVRKLPSGYTEGEPYYTAESVWGLNYGFELLDVLIIVPILTVIVVLMLAQSRDWIVDVWLLVTSIPILWFAGRAYIKYQTGTTYAVEPGLYLVLVGGILFILLGAGDLIHITTKDN